MPRNKKRKSSTKLNTADDDQPRMMISVKMLAGYLPTIHLKHDATVADLADAVISSDLDAYRNCRPMFVRVHTDGSTVELEDESRQLSSFGLQCDVEEELVMMVENVSALIRQVHIFSSTGKQYAPTDLIKNRSQGIRRMTSRNSSDC
jgi:hypothetical protein